MNEYSKSLTLQVFLRTSLLQAWATMRHLPLLGRINTTGHYFLISTLNNGDEAARKATKQLSLTSMWWKLAFIFIMSFKSSQYCINLTKNCGEQCKHRKQMKKCRVET